VGQNESRGADELGAASLPSGQGDNPDRCISQRHPRLDRRPAEDGRALQSEEDEDAAEEALDAGAFAQLLGRPGGRETVAALLPFRVPGDDRLGAKHRMDPGDQLEAPVAGIQADDARAQAQEPDGQLQRGSGEGGIFQELLSVRQSCTACMACNLGRRLDENGTLSPVSTYGRHYPRSKDLAMLGSLLARTLSPGCWCAEAAARTWRNHVAVSLLNPWSCDTTRLVVQSAHRHQDSAHGVVGSLTGLT
jgi:hypothetical protein